MDKFATVHNSVADQLLHLEERLTRHEVKLTDLGRAFPQEQSQGRPTSIRHWPVLHLVPGFASRFIPIGQNTPSGK
ncbi:Hypothetical predicted protein, partial [Pelobates cultripes]